MFYTKSALIHCIASFLAIVVTRHAIHFCTMPLPIFHKMYVQEKSSCDDCKEKEKEESALCAFKYLILFFWYSMLSIAFMIVIVMDLATGFTQGFIKSFIEWYIDANNILNRFFRSLGC